jgi:hypothetical protein
MEAVLRTVGMMRRWMLVVPLLLAMSGVAGCGDDEAATTVAPITTAAPSTTTEAATTTTDAAATTTTAPRGVTVVVKLEVTGGVGSGDGQGTFTATGAAVDAGTVCPSGAIVWALRSRTEKGNYYQEQGTLTATCDDGDAGFTLSTEERVRYGIVGTIAGSWTGEGTGALAGWVGEGTEEGTCRESGATQFYDCETVYTGVISAED